MAEGRRPGGSFLFDRVVVGIVVVPVLGNLAAGIVENGPNDASADIHQLLVGSLGGHSVGLTRTDYQEDAVGQGSENPGIGGGEDWRSVQDDQIKALGKFLKQDPHPDATEQ